MVNIYNTSQEKLAETSRRLQSVEEDNASQHEQIEKLQEQGSDRVRESRNTGLTSGEETRLHQVQ